MSWFKHTPPKNPPPVRHHLHPHRTSPVADKMLEEAKAMGPAEKNKKKKSSTS
jgi:hypothetical protein